MALKPTQKELSSDQPEAVAMSVTIENKVLKNYSDPVNPWDVPVELPLPEDEDLLVRHFSGDASFQELNLDTDALAVALQAQVSSAQWDALVAYQAELIAADEVEVVKSDYSDFQAYCEALVRDGKNLTSGNLEAYYDALKTKKDKVKKPK